MKELVRDIAKFLVDHPDEVMVERHEEGDRIIMELRAAKEDIGKIIGRNGNTIRAIRAVIRAASFHCRKRIVVRVEETGGCIRSKYRQPSMIRNW